MTNGTFGHTSGTQFAFYDPDTQSWKMWPATGLWGSIEFSETWPKTGYMQDGAAFELATLGGHTTANACLSSPRLPTPKASDGNHGDSPADAKRRAPSLTSVTVHFGKQQYLPTPNARDGNGGGAQHPDKRRAGGHQVCLTDAAVEMGEAKCLPTPQTQDIAYSSAGYGPTLGEEVRKMFPTPKASDGIMGRPRTTGRPIEKSTHLGTIVTLLPTPNTMDSLPVREGEAREKQLRRGDMNAPKRRFMGNLREDIVHETAGVSTFGPYEAAVHRWEQVTRPAPEPTELNSKGKPRLAPRFAEWMMGLSDGWVTSPDIGLTRAQQLKAIGNGVCPQQGAAALRMLLDDFNNEGKANENS